MFQENNDKNRLFNLAFICLSYSILITFLSYFTLNYNIEFLKNSFLFNLYYSLDNSFGGYLIAGIWAFLDVFVVVTLGTFLFILSEKIVSSIDRNV